MALWCTLSYLESITSRVSDGSCRSYGSLKSAILDLVSNNVLLSYLKALDATDDVPVFTGRSKFPKLQGTGCKNSLWHVSSTNRLVHRDCSWNKSPRFALSLRSTQKLLNTSALNSLLFLCLRVNLFDLAFQPPPKSRRKQNSLRVLLIPNSGSCSKQISVR